MTVALTTPPTTTTAATTATARSSTAVSTAPLVWGLGRRIPRLGFSTELRLQVPVQDLAAGLGAEDAGRLGSEFRNASGQGLELIGKKFMCGDV